MSTLQKIADFLTGGLGSAVVETVKEYYPPSMTEQERELLSLRIKEATDKHTIATAKLANEATAEFNKMVLAHEGTAQDLKTLPILGPLMIFLRGSQRIIWSFGTLYIDYKVFSGSWKGLDEQLLAAVYLINVLVLSFLFGERAIKNAAPFIERIVKARGGING
jgi:hypothetical protein